MLDLLLCQAQKVTAQDNEIRREQSIMVLLKLVR